MTDSEDVVGTQEAARQLGVSVRTIQLWVEKGMLEAWKTSGGHRRITTASLKAALKKREHKVEGVEDDNVRILVVEDEATVQSYYQALFGILCPNAEVTMVDNSYTALIELGRLLPDLLLVDVDLPSVNGVELLRSIESTLETEKVNVAVITGLNAEQLALRGTIPKRIPVYGKPLSIDNLSLLLKKFSIKTGSK